MTSFKILAIKNEEIWNLLKRIVDSLHTLALVSESVLQLERILAKACSLSLQNVVAYVVRYSSYIS